MNEIIYVPVPVEEWLKENPSHVLVKVELPTNDWWDEHLENDNKLTSTSL